MREQLAALLYEHGFSRHLLLTGGQLLADQPSLAEVMRDFLADKYDVPMSAMLLEDRALGTTENAELSVELLHKEDLLHGILHLPGGEAFTCRQRTSTTSIDWITFSSSLSCAGRAGAVPAP